MSESGSMRDPSSQCQVWLVHRRSWVGHPLHIELFCRWLSWCVDVRFWNGWRCFSGKAESHKSGTAGVASLTASFVQTGDVLLSTYAPLLRSENKPNSRTVFIGCAIFHTRARHVLSGVGSRELAAFWRSTLGCRRMWTRWST